MTRTEHTFIGCDASYDESDIVLFGAPFDSTTSFRPGARFGCSAMRNESFGIETFSPYQDRDLACLRIFDGGDLELPFGSPEAALDMIAEQTDDILGDGKIPVMLGGEHLVTLGAVRSAVRRHPDLRIVHFDAHADLRDEYLGVKLSHACVMRRCHELVGDGRIFQFGIRSGDGAEFEWGARHVKTCRFGFSRLPDAVREIGEAPVYVTVDLDVLDPSCFPGTGTPEAGGVSFAGLLRALKTALRLNVVAMDFTELSPACDASGASTALACKILREALLLLGGRNT
ncbi:MAG: agmatinase [Kiritimatiellia bacterium]|jgi:agmatinase